ncbi:RyR domain-containing protein [Catellatospora tritici]|uniref:RyR domain-containing protein n=1 Tax=Catellatospora tritici TaxID=2851566 RepID=UPI001C2DCB53|nr:RyR domain-containing protein [Catellatospora tritici]MBV1856332.1 hypothetical protein [Catellatospora tritici]
MASVATGRNTRILTLARVGFFLVIVAALGLGHWGMYVLSMSPKRPEMGRGWLDLIYYNLQLFALDSDPLGEAKWLPLQLQFARFLAPLATVYALFEAARALFATEWRRWRQRRRRGHVVVIGTTALADAIAENLRAAGRRVAQIDAADPTDLRDAGVGGAAKVYACADDRHDPGVNVLAALAACQVPRRRRTPLAFLARRRRPTLAVHAHISDPALALALQARRLGMPTADGQNLNFFNADELAAWVLVRDDPFDFGPTTAPHIVVAGLGAFGQALVVEFARRWRFTRDNPVQARVTLVGPDADRIAEELRGWKVVAESCELSPETRGLPYAVPSGTQDPPHRVYLCDQDDQAAVRTALTAVRLWAGGPASLVVRVDSMSTITGYFGGGSKPAMLDDIKHRLRLVVVSELVQAHPAIHSDLLERLGRAVHENYLRNQLARGVAMGDKPAMTSWEMLPEYLRDSNREQAAQIGEKLDLIGCTVGPRDAGVEFRFHKDEVEYLAKVEKERWNEEKRAADWTYAAERNDALKHHNLLVSWEELAEVEREKDRDAVRCIPDLLADAGLQVVRVEQARIPAQTRVDEAIGH